ncbi:MAG: hypothetical protein WDM79_06620 [Terricaulis sp.]
MQAATPAQADRLAMAPKRRGLLIWSGERFILISRHATAAIPSPFAAPKASGFA